MTLPLWSADWEERFSGLSESGMGGVLRRMMGRDRESATSYPSSFNRNTWWEQPDLTFGGFKPEPTPGGRPGAMRVDPGGRDLARYGQAPPFDARVPTPFVPEWGGDVQGFYDWYQGAEDWERRDVRSQGRAQNRAAAARQTAIEGLARMFADVEDVRTEFRDDPNRAAMAETLRHRTTPEYDMITDLEAGAMRNRIAQAWAREQSGREAGAAGRGVLTSGPTLQNLAAQRAIAASGGVQLGANVEMANRAARERALGDLGGFTDRGVALEQNFSRIMGGIQTEIARLEAGGEVLYTDYGAYEAARVAKEQFDQNFEQAERYMALYEETQKTNWLDLAELALSTIGTGIWDSGSSSDDGGWVESTLGGAALGLF